MTLTSAEAAACTVLLQLALAEDLGTTGDRTSLATIPDTVQGKAAFVVRTPGIIAGLQVAGMVCQAVDRSLKFQPLVEDGRFQQRGAVLATVEGSLQKILIAERTALNFLQRLCGIATLTRRYTDAITGLPVKLLDTRKTTPGWRLLEKYAVRAGGGVNHRMGLYDAILIKDNHIAGQGDSPSPVRRTVELARAYPGNAGLPVEVEVDSIQQLEEVLSVKPEIVLLDNMTNDQLRTCVMLRNREAPGVLLEASGGVNLTTVRGIAETGVDRISVGAITHSAVALDIALDHLK